MPLQDPAVEGGSADESSAERPRGRFNHVFAAIDLGTNNCRLLAARAAPHGFRVIDSFSRIIRLGEGLHADGRMSDAAMARAVEALSICVAKMRRRGVSRWRAVATAACRDAANRDEFLGQVKTKTGLNLEVISAAEEARLALLGCAPLLDFEHKHALVFDIGGGSTELMWLELKRSRAPKLLGWVSLPCGVVTMAERWGDRVESPEAYGEMVAHVREQLRPFEAEHKLSEHLRDGTIQLLGTSGTVTTVAAVLLDLPRYDRARVDGRWFAFDDIAAVSRRLAKLPIEARMAHPCIGADRAELVVVGCAILEAIYATWPIPHLRVADRGVREGLLFELMRAADRQPPHKHRPTTRQNR